MGKNSLLFICFVLGMSTMACSSLFPASTAPQSSEEFIIAQVTQVAPDDILTEVGYFSGGGGPCDCSDGTYPVPQFKCQNTQASLMIPNAVFSCGWDENEEVKGFIKYPNGKVLQTPAENAEFAAMVFLTFTPTLQDPVGVYKFTLQGKSGKITTEVTYKKPEGPHLFLVGPDELLLYGFKPGEMVNLYYYRDRKFIAVQPYRIGDDGQLLVKTSVSLNFPVTSQTDDFLKGFFAATGEKSGEVHLLYADPYGGQVDYVKDTIKK